MMSMINSFLLDTFASSWLLAESIDPFRFRPIAALSGALPPAIEYIPCGDARSACQFAELIVSPVDYTPHIRRVPDGSANRIQ